MSPGKEVVTQPWMDGNIGPLKSGRILTITLKRAENTSYVNADYDILNEEAIEIFEAFLGLRIKYMKHKYAHPPVVPNIKDDPQFHMISKEDVHRVAMFICDPKVVQTQTNKFISTFFKENEDKLNIEQFIKVLHLECERRKLNKWECFFILFEDPSSSTLSYIVAVIIMILIVVSSVCFVLSTDPSFQVESNDDQLPPEPHPAFIVIEKICIYCFLIEYLCRVFVVWAVRKGVVGSGTQRYAIMECFPTTDKSSSSSSLVDLDAEIGKPSLNPKGVSRKRSIISNHTDDVLEGKSGTLSFWYRAVIDRTLTYVVSPMNLIDLIAILPFFISLLIGGEGGNLSSLRILRLARVMRIFKLAKKNEGINMLSITMSASRGSLNLLVFFGIIGTVVFGSLIYFTESGEWHNPEECVKALPDLASSGVCDRGMYLRPDKYGIGKELTPFSSIPRTFWWVVVTATTVGYGDMYPTTSLGKLVATFAMVSGLLVLALPISIIGTNFLVCYEKLDERNRRAKILEELEIKMKLEEKEAKLEAESNLLKKQRDTIEKMPWKKKKNALSPGPVGSGKLNKLKIVSSTLTKSPKFLKSKDILSSFSFKSKKPKNIKAAAVAAHWTVSGVKNDETDEVGEEDGDDDVTTPPATPSPSEGNMKSGGDASPFPTTTMSDKVTLKVQNKALLKVKGVKLRSQKKSVLEAHKLQKHLKAQQKTIETGGHQSLIGLKAKARLTPSFLFDTQSVLNPPTNLKFINLERKTSILSLTLAGFGNTTPTTQKLDDVLGLKYETLLKKAQNVLECIQTLHTRGKMDDPTVLNVAREIVDLTRKVILLKERESSPLRLIGMEVDAAVLVILAWLGRDADSFFRGDVTFEEGEGESFKLEAEDERRVRLHLFEFTVTALEIAKKHSVNSNYQNNVHNEKRQNMKDKEECKEKGRSGMKVGEGGDIQGLKDSLTGSSSEVLGDSYGEGSFKVSMGEKGMDFTLIQNKHSDSSAMSDMGIPTPSQSIERQCISDERWWTRWFI